MVSELLVQAVGRRKDLEFDRTVHTNYRSYKSNGVSIEFI